jgi:hypothetical protein
MDAIYSKSLKAGGRTYFIDVREARNKAKYLTISETKPSSDGTKKFTRSSIMVFNDQAEQFREVFTEAVDLLKQ